MANINNVKVFAENTSNILSDSEFNNSNERLSGYQSGTVVRSNIMNAILRQDSLIANAIIKYVISDESTSSLNKTYGPNTSLNDFTELFNTFFSYQKTKLNDLLDMFNAANTSGYIVYFYNNSLKPIVYNPSSINQNQILCYNPTKTENNGYLFVSEQDLDITHADSSDEASSLLDFKNTNTKADQNVEFEFGPVGSKTVFKKSVDNVNNSKNVDSTIGGKDLIDIFESDGTTVKNSTTAKDLLNAGTNELVYTQNSQTKFLSAPAEGEDQNVLVSDGFAPYWTGSRNLRVGSADIAAKANNLNTGSAPDRSLITANGQGETDYVEYPSLTPDGDDIDGNLSAYDLTSVLSGSSPGTPKKYIPGFKRNLELNFSRQTGNLISQFKFNKKIGNFTSYGSLFYYSINFNTLISNFANGAELSALDNLRVLIELDSSSNIESNLVHYSTVISYNRIPYGVFASSGNQGFHSTIFKITDSSTTHEINLCCSNGSITNQPTISRGTTLTLYLGTNAKAALTDYIVTVTLLP